MFAHCSVTMINVPKEYLKICWNNSIINENKMNHCIIETVYLKTKIQDLPQLVQILCSMDNTFSFQNEIIE